MGGNALYIFDQALWVCENGGVDCLQNIAHRRFCLSSEVDGIGGVYMAAPKRFCVDKIAVKEEGIYNFIFDHLQHFHSPFSFQRFSGYTPSSIICSMKATIFSLSSW